MDDRGRTDAVIRWALGLAYALVLLAFGARLAVRGVHRTRAAGTGRQATIISTVVPSAIGVVVCSSALIPLLVFVDIQAGT